MDNVNRLKDVIKLMRPKQWLKNGFVLMGIIFDHSWGDLITVKNVILILIAFCFASSAVYIFNDIKDIESDRRHPAKCKRPLASGRITLSAAWFFYILCLVLSLCLSIMVSFNSLIILCIYVTLNLFYTLRLKEIVILDVFCIAAGFYLRILAGTYGVLIPASNWLLLCGIMISLFLGFSKRRAELSKLGDISVSSRGVLGEYSLGLLDILLGITATLTILTYAVYTVDEQTIALHGTSALLWTVPFVVYGIFRYIYNVIIMDKGEDTSNDLLTDKHMIITVLIWLIMVITIIK